MRKSLGFTLVELVVVIVVVVVLTTMTIFGFSAWRRDAAETVVKNDLMQAKAGLKMTAVNNNAYPSSLSSVYTANSDVTLTYILRANGLSYCLKSQSKSVTTVVWYLDSKVGEVSQTACS